MPSPFPGMDPWLEAPARWPGFHDTLVIKTMEVLQPRLRSRGYYVNPGERVWVSESDREVGPDVVVTRSRTQPTQEGAAALAVLDVDEPIHIPHTGTEFHEGFVEIYDAATHELVTCIEFVSPTNKSDSQGSELYKKKQSDLAEGGVHLVEIDFIRREPHVLDVPWGVVQAVKPWHYLVNLVRRGSSGYDVYPIRLQNRLPRIRIPLKTGDVDEPLDLQEAFTRAYDVGPYPERCHYDEPPPLPKLSVSDAAWADGILKQAGLRG